MRISSQSLGVIHFVGIGGIGMSGVAEILTSLGYSVRGSDRAENTNVLRLRGLGISVIVGQKPENIQGASVVVISSAIREDNPELMAARQANIPVVKRAEMLAEVMRLQPCISVAGTHGKTTTTSIAASVLDQGGLDPTVVSGGIINAYGTNARLGSGAWMVVEADESDGTFAKLPATIAIVTNIESEHMTYYGSFDTLKNAFQAYVQNIPFYGLGILCADDPVTYELSTLVQDRRIITYGIEHEAADFKAVNIRTTAQGHYFDLVISDHARHTLKMIDSHRLTHTDFFLPMVGYHNILNALSVIVCAVELGMNLTQIQAGLSQFMGVERRFTRLGALKGVSIIDDYAHHPTEIKATLAAARHVVTETNKVIAVLQPHRYSRLSDMFSEFSSSFEDADLIVILPVYAAGEMPNLLATHTALGTALDAKGKQVFAVDGTDKLQGILKDHASAGDICVFMGAGDVSTACYRFFQNMGGQLNLGQGAIKHNHQSTAGQLTENLS